ncbi:hypothetical protein ARMGADRAFT_1084929 [Armillaria gallica]|uniref:Uncharacterized protein n=1 Tax=Armillaria gallica TaxID=47427 RepID=A0A2H3CY45_ARMGA|nr:hypothetical protein ARMGADRAFT_1084929 [Armillaria gallica]
MEHLRCLVDGNICTIVIELERPTLRRGPIPYVTGTDVVVTIASSRGFCDIPITVDLLDAQAQSTIILGLDWFKSFVLNTTFHSGSLLPIVPLDPLLNVYSLLCDPTSPVFMWTCSSASMTATILDHDMAAIVAANPDIRLTQLLVEHLLGGLCAGRRGPACVKFMSACREATIRPSIFALQSVVYPFTVLDSLPARDRDLSAACGLDPVTSGCNLTHVLSSRLQALLQYMPFKGGRDYALRFLYEMGDTSSDCLSSVSRAHGMRDVESHTMIAKRCNLHQHMMNGGCVSNMNRPLLTMPVGCLELLSYI